LPEVDLYLTNFDWSNFVVYADGQLIIPGNPYQQKALSQEEINQLLANLEILGFYNLDNEHLHNFGNQDPPKITDGMVYCISVAGEKEHDLCSYKPYESFLVPEMKNILQYLNNYQPDGLSIYLPDRILLYVQAGRNPYVTELPKDAILWTESSISLETDTEKMIYVDGDIAKELYRLYGDKIYVFTENGTEYTVSMEAILPHQELRNLN